MNIIVITGGFPDANNNSVAANFVLSEAKAYALNGASVTVLTPHRKGAEKLEYLRDNLRVIRFQYFWPQRLQKLREVNKPIYNHNTLFQQIQKPILAIVFAIQIFKYALKADILHCQWSNTALLALPTKWILGRKIVLTVRGSDIRTLPKWLNRFIHRHVDAAVDYGSSHKWYKDYKSNYPANFIRLPFIVEKYDSTSIPSDMKEALEGKEDSFVICYLGRLEKHKIKLFQLPTLDLIYAAARLKKLKKEFHIFYIGDGDSDIKNEIQRLICENDLHRYISMLGLKSNVMDYLPFIHLGVGGSAINAVSQEFSFLHKPQILVYSEENTDVHWRDKENSLFMKQNDVDDLVGVLTYAIRDKNRLSKIGNMANSVMSNYIKGLEEGGHDYLVAFNKLLKQ